MKKVILWCGLLVLLFIGAQTLEALGMPEETTHRPGTVGVRAGGVRGRAYSP